MEKTNCFSIVSMILIRSTSVFPLIGIFILCSILLNIHEICSCLWYLIRSIFHIILIVFKGRSETKHTVQTGVEPISKPSPDAKILETNISRGEVELVMERIGIFMNPRVDKIEEKIGADEISNMFDDGVSLEEVREAFDVFDENCDGFIDADELEKVLSSLGYNEVTKHGCEKMIRVYDCNGDGRIDVGEFVKVLETSFSLN